LLYFCRMPNIIETTLIKMTSNISLTKDHMRYGCIAILFFFAIACNKESEVKLPNKYLVDYSIGNTYFLPIIESVLSVEMEEYPDMASIIDHAHYSVQLYKINYKTHYHDSVVIASGLVCLPISEEKFPIISFQNGTNTAHDNAPSINQTNANYMMMEFMASNGYIVLIPDYIGFGSSASILHPYYHRISTNNAIIDLIHAFNELEQMDNIQAADNDTIYLMDYSQGGWATMSAFEEIQQDNQTSLVVSAVSCGAGAYDLMAMSNYVLGLETFPGPLYLPYFVYSQQVLGAIQDPLSKFFQEPYAGLIPELFNGTYSNDEVNSQLTDTIPDLVTADMLENLASGTEYSQLRDLLTENSVTGWNTTVSINLYHGTNDQNVPPAQSIALYNDFINSGSSPDRVNYIELDGDTHETGLLPWGISTINWFNTLENK
jgi:hypothetical protein